MKCAYRMSVQTSNHRWRFIMGSKDITVFLVGIKLIIFPWKRKKKKRLQLLRAVIQRRYYEKIVK